MIGQKRYEDAEKEVKNILSAQPQNTDALKMLGVIFIETKRNDDAESVLGSAIAANPNDDFTYYLLGRVKLNRKQYDEASDLINKAISLNPDEADYFGVLSSIKEYKKEFKAMLQLANEGLSIDPENLLCLNNRSTALVKLGQKEEAFKTADKSLELDPENPMTHANYGWAQLERGNHKKALEHFRESLRYDPNSSYAQAGMMQALKAKYLVYRLFLKYAFWMSNMKSKLQWGIIIGFIVLMRIFNQLAETNPQARPFIVPIIILYVTFAISTWIIGPLSNLFLRFNYYGRYLLTHLEKISAAFTGISLLISLTGIVLYINFSSEAFLAMAAFGLIMMIPLGSMFSSRNERGRRIMVSYSLLMLLIGLVALYISFAEKTAMNGVSLIFIFLFVGYQFMANYFLIKES